MHKVAVPFSSAWSAIRVFCGMTVTGPDSLVHSAYGGLTAGEQGFDIGDTAIRALLEAGYWRGIGDAVSIARAGPLVSNAVALCKLSFRRMGVARRAAGPVLGGRR